MLLDSQTMPCDVVVLGKCAEALWRGATERLEIARGFVVVPRGYGAIASSAEVELHVTSHPLLSAESFAAGEQLQHFVRDSQNPLVVMISGGSSSAVESPLSPAVSREDLLGLQEVLLRSGLDIEAMNTVRKHLSAIKGGRLALLSMREVTTLILSDVDPAKPHLVGSGPTLPDPTTNHDAAAILERIEHPVAHRLAVLLQQKDVLETPKTLPLAGGNETIGDNETLKRAAQNAAVARGFDVRYIDGQIDGDVEQGARRLFDVARSLGAGEVAVAGGEVTLRVEGSGKGGRCSELAARVARILLAEGERTVTALFAGSDGIDGNSEAAGVILDPARYGREGDRSGQIDTALRHSDAISVAEELGRAIRMGPTGNNLRDLFILARG
jgi:hydroxypyruvate reductase